MLSASLPPTTGAPALRCHGTDECVFYTFKRYETCQIPRACNEMLYICIHVKIPIIIMLILGKYLYYQEPRAYNEILYIVLTAKD